MGARTQVLVKDGKEHVYLYAHHQSHDIANIVRKALSRHERWMDFEYLARIIFCEMIKGHESESDGFGIGSHQHGDLDNLFIVDVEEQDVSCEGLLAFSKRSFDKFIQELK